MPDNPVLSVQIVFSGKIRCSVRTVFCAGRNDGMYVTSIAANRCSSIYNLAVANNYCKTFIDWEGNRCSKRRRNGWKAFVWRSKSFDGRERGGYRGRSYECDSYYSCDLAVGQLLFYRGFDSACFSSCFLPIRMRRLIRSYPACNYGKYKLVICPEKIVSFSWGHSHCPVTGGLRTEPRRTCCMSKCTCNIDIHWIYFGWNVSLYSIGSILRMAPDAWTSWSAWIWSR